MSYNESLGEVMDTSVGMERSQNGSPILHYALYNRVTAQGIHIVYFEIATRTIYVNEQLARTHYRNAPHVDSMCKQSPRFRRTHVPQF